MNLNFSVSELIHSDNAIKAGLDNMPAIKEIDNLLNLIFYCLQPIRDKLKKPMIITSGYRNMKVNFLAGGKANSQHLKGQAADFTVQGMKVKQIIDFILESGIEFDQLINEYDKWVHISYKKGKNRKEVFAVK